MARPLGIRGRGLNNVFANLKLMDDMLSPFRVFWLDPANGGAGESALSLDEATDSIANALALTLPNIHDTVLLVGNGAASGTARLSTKLDWNQNATHLVGMGTPVFYSQRARIAPPTTLVASSANNPFITFSADGCVVKNIEMWCGFATGQAAQVGVLVSGNRNHFRNCHFAGIADAASAADAGSRSLKISGQENVFEDCVIGVDTVSRGAVANASLEFSGGATRNVFRRCIFPFMVSNGAPLGILGTGNGCVDRENIFDDCLFLNAIKSTSTTMTALLSFTTAAPGGLIIFKKCALVGITKWGDTNGLANSYLDMPVPDQAGGGRMLTPS